MNRLDERHRIYLTLAALTRRAMFLPDRPVNWTWKQINDLPTMTSWPITKDPSERN